ncbi:NUDIX domain-containing protein [Pseudochryseolinea flava]|uniref:NTP pyrophosphohydrolase n=1 Tax=Pseudochryseolinea flava TaxID=2059302 RepID=A0A364Y3V7_9BACT|nr:NUDIX domain-containing protein [Pseudochryseolinea flava]RAW01409.1 NTP pyrophosphohydrolase [Pseudochryseolinea flava]
MPELSAGLVMCRKVNGALEFFLVHPGGPFYAKKNEGVWSIPKGMPDNGEALLDAALREFEEETGIVPHKPFKALKPVRMKSGKVVHAWTFLGKWDPAAGIVCNTFELEWPPHSGKKINVPENDRAGWFSLEKAKEMIRPAQIPLLEEALQSWS